MIPKIIHHIWIGNNPLPNEFKEFRNKWMNLYEDYNFIFWNDELVEASNIVDDSIKEYYYSNYKLAFKADLLRFKILEKFGGLYLDTDTEPLRKMPEDFLKYKFFAGRQRPHPQVAIGLMASEPDNNLVKYYNYKMLENIRLNTDENGLVSQELWRITGPEYFDKICDEYINVDGYKFFNSDYFYPYGWTELDRRHEDFYNTSPNSYSVHHWTMSWW